MIFVIIAVVTVISVSQHSRSLREALLYGVGAGIFLGLLTGGIAGVALAKTWRMSPERAALYCAGIECLWKGPLLAALCGVGFALRGNKSSAEATK
jgi:hypothetical protein